MSAASREVTRENFIKVLKEVTKFEGEIKSFDYHSGWWELSFNTEDKMKEMLSKLSPKLGEKIKIKDVSKCLLTLDEHYQEVIKLLTTPTKAATAPAPAKVEIRDHYVYRGAGSVAASVIGEPTGDVGSIFIKGGSTTATDRSTATTVYIAPPRAYIAPPSNSCMPLEAYAPEAPEVPKAPEVPEVKTNYPMHNEMEPAPTESFLSRLASFTWSSSQKPDITPPSAPDDATIAAAIDTIAKARTATTIALNGAASARISPEGTIEVRASGVAMATAGTMETVHGGRVEGAGRTTVIGARNVKEMSHTDIEARDGAFVIGATGAPGNSFVMRGSSTTASGSGIAVGYAVRR